MKKILVLLILSFLLFSCGEEERNEEKTEKQDFFVQTQSLDSFSGSYKIKKT
jgi:outer membrane biogenesis lipoprotein LolB